MTSTSYLTTGQAARQLGVSRRSLHRAMARGEIAATRQAPGGWSRLLATDVEAYAQRQAPRMKVRAPIVPPRLPADLAGADQRLGVQSEPRRSAAGLARYESEQRLWATFDLAAIGIAQVALDGRWLRVNKKLSGILGYTPEALLRQTVHEIMLAGDDPERDPFRDLLAGTQQTCSMEKCFVSRNGARVWVTLSISLVRDSADDTPAFYIAVVEDVSARKQADEAVCLADERFRLLVNSMPDCAVYMLDPRGCVMIWNEGAQRLKLYDASEILGRPVSIFYTPEDREQGLPEQGLRLATEHGHYETEGWRVRKDGSRFWAAVRITAIYDATKQLIAYGKVTRDLSEPRRAEEAIQQLNANLEERVMARTADLAAVNTQLTAINSELEAFAYSVSHDLRTPLRAISGFGNILLTSYDEVLDAKGLHYLRRIQTATTQMGQLIDDLLALSRLTRAEMHTGLVDLTALAGAVAEALRQTEPDRLVTWDIAEGLTATGDASLLFVVFDNLLGNAWKFTGRHPTAAIEVGTRQEEGETVYFVRDDGAGFDMAYAGKLFGAFQRLHTISEFAGTGIGLATVQRVIHRHGGRVWAEGAVEQGTTISFTLAPPKGAPHATGQ